MRAFVFSGGSNLGPTQIGAARALLERGILPDMLVGCSAGAINAAQLARELSPAEVERMAHNWRTVTRHDVYPGSRMSIFLRFVRGQDSLYCNRNFCAMLQRNGVTPAHTFGASTVVPLYITATNLRTGRLHVFGDDPNDRILDALMASTALTPLHPPWDVNGERYVDGGTVTPLPLRVAIDRGATEIYALHIEGAKEPVEAKAVRGVVGVLARSVDAMLKLQAEHDLHLARTNPAIKLHYIHLHVPTPPHFRDFGCCDDLIEQGYVRTREYLDHNYRPATPPSTPENLPWRRRFGRALAAGFRPQTLTPAPVPIEREG